MQKGKFAMFGAGCFWGVEELFRELPGVIETLVGYSGGKTENPTYEEVCTNTSGHAEVVLVKYDPLKIKYEALLKIFWENHNPTTPNQQGPDFGSQYRSAIFYYDEEQKAAAIKSKEDLEKARVFGFNRIVTEIEPAKPFFKAEEYHQQYLHKRGAKTCHF